MDIYCFNCKKKTKTNNESYTPCKGNKHLIRGNCTKCGKRKSQFVSLETAKKGGFIFTIPAILAAAGAAGSLAGGAASIANAVNKKKSADKLLKETQRHNKAMEGKGLFLGPPKGKGLFLKPYKK